MTVFGPIDTVRNSDYWAFEPIAPATYPPPEKWPATEAWFDVYMFPPVTEFTIQRPMAQTAYVWGYLAARE